MPAGTTRKLNPAPVPEARRAFEHRETQLIESPEVWQADKRKQDHENCGVDAALWCVDGKQYDLADYDHPGGDVWLELTKGTDCSDLFHTCHMDQAKVRRVLAKFYVRDAPVPRDKLRTRFEWSDDASFYNTLQRRALEVLPSRAARATTASFLYVCCFALMLFVDAFFVMCWARSAAAQFGAALVAGFALHALFGIGHNFFHQAVRPWSTAWRWQYVFDLTLFSSHTWKVTHAISHHTYSNTEIDTEVSSVEPFLYFLSNKPRNAWPLVYVAFAFICSTASVLDYARHVLYSILGKETWRTENFLPIVEFALLANFQGYGRSLALFLTMHMFNSLLITSISFAVHRTEHAWTEGDADGATERDFGKFILRATHDHSQGLNTVASLFLFGGLNVHVLHHLFPAVDKSKVVLLEPVLRQVCDEFGVQAPRYHHFGDLFVSVLRRHDMLPSKTQRARDKSAAAAKKSKKVQ